MNWTPGKELSSDMDDRRPETQSLSSKAGVIKDELNDRWQSMKDEYHRQKGEQQKPNNKPQTIKRMPRKRT